MRNSKDGRCILHELSNGFFVPKNWWCQGGCKERSAFCNGWHRCHANINVFVAQFPSNRNEFISTVVFNLVHILLTHVLSSSLIVSYSSSPVVIHMTENRLFFAFCLNLLEEWQRAAWTLRWLLVSPPGSLVLPLHYKLQCHISGVQWQELGCMSQLITLAWLRYLPMHWRGVFYKFSVSKNGESRLPHPLISFRIIQFEDTSEPVVVTAARITHGGVQNPIKKVKYKGISHLLKWLTVLKVRML